MFPLPVRLQREREREGPGGREGGREERGGAGGGDQVDIYDIGETNKKSIWHMPNRGSRSSLRRSPSQARRYQCKGQNECLCEKHSFFYSTHSSGLKMGNECAVLKWTQNLYRRQIKITKTQPNPKKWAGKRNGAKSISLFGPGIRVTVKGHGLSGH